MAFEQTNKTKMAVIKQSGKGVPTLPGSGADYIALQDGFSLTPAREVIENAELKGDISESAPIPGVESTAVDMSHYLRHSGVEGSEPDHGVLLENLLGTKEVESTEYLTTTGSTVSIVKLASGGSSLEAGQSILVKDPTNGYSIRPIFSIATNDLTLGFDLSAAPATGLGTGKCVSYKPADTSDYLSFVDYRGDGGVTQLASDVRLLTGEITIDAGQPINMSFSGSGITGMYVNPIEITASDFSLDFDEGGSELNASITQKIYRDPYSLASEIQTKMDALASANITVSYIDEGANIGKFEFASDGVTFNLLWNSGTNTATSIAAKIGFSTAADSTGATTYNSSSVLSYASLYTPILDNRDPLVAKNNGLLIGENDELTCREGSTLSVSIDKTATNANSWCAETGISDSVITSRSVSISGTLYLVKHDLSIWEKYKNSTTIKFAYTAGEKDSSGNWIAGKCVQVFAPYFKIEEYNLEDQDGLVAITFTGRAFNIASGIGQIFINMV